MAFSYPQERLHVTPPIKPMKIGIDLDGTLYSHPDFFTGIISLMYSVGWRFFCISSHGRNEWEADCEQLEKKGVPSSLISPELMHSVRHGSLEIKGKAADQCDLVFDDDVRLKQFTKTPVFSPL